MSHGPTRARPATPVLGLQKTATAAPATSGPDVARGHQGEACNTGSLIRRPRLRRLQHRVATLYGPTRARPAARVPGLQKTATATPATSGRDVARAHQGEASNRGCRIVQVRDRGALTSGPDVARAHEGEAYNTGSLIAEDRGCGACNIGSRRCTGPRGRGLQHRFPDCRRPRLRRLQHRVAKLHEPTRARSALPVP